MYITVSTLKKSKVGALVVLEKDQTFCEIVAKDSTGDIIGFAMHNQPEGCVCYYQALENFEGKTIKGRIIVAMDNVSILQCDEFLFNELEFPRKDRLVRVSF